MRGFMDLPRRPDLGVLLWLACHLGRVRLAGPLAVVIGAIAWNLAVTMGILGILGGENTGFEWLEMPRFASVLLFLSYMIIGLAGVVTFRQRRDPQLFISQWFILAALFWFPMDLFHREFPACCQPGSRRVAGGH